MVENLVDDPTDRLDPLPETPHIYNYDAYVRIPTSVQSLQLDGCEGAVYRSREAPKAQIPIAERPEGLPSPLFPTYLNRTSYYGNEQTWQSRPTSRSAHLNTNWSVSRDQGTPLAKGGNSANALRGHSHHMSLPDPPVDRPATLGRPFTPQFSAASRQDSPATTGFNYAVNTPSPTFDHPEFNHGAPSGSGPPVSMTTNWSSSSHVLESSLSHPPFPSSWIRTPPNGQGG
jgi:hypothetical protein